MIDIKKIKTQFRESFEIVTDEGIFEIFYGGNLDLYWNCRLNISDCDDSKSFLITKENYFLYKLFDDLYNEIKNKDIGYNCYGDEEIPFIDDKIVWYSDDSIYEDASKLIVEQDLDSYKVIFEKRNDKFGLNYLIRINNNRSRYKPFNILFMKMYHNLFEYNPDYHQIHMEEYLYHKKLVKRKETI